jgi:hypothetical protein
MDMPSAEHDRLPGAGRPGPARHGDPERRERATAERRHDRRSTDADPDVLLDVPTVKVDEIDLEVDDLRARVSLEAAVLDLLSLNVGADAALGRVKLTIKGVEAQALLKVRLDNVSEIIRRMLETIDANPEVLTSATRGLGSAAGEVGHGARHAVEDVGTGAGRAVRDVGTGAGGAVRDVGSGAGRAVEDVGSGVGGAVQDVGTGAGGAVQDVGTGAGEATKDVGSGAGEATKDVGSGVGSELGSGELAGALAKKSAQAGRDAAHRVAHALLRITES